MKKTVREEIYEENLQKHGCGYYAVCVTRDCPCSPGAAVSKGFSNEVWDSMMNEFTAEKLTISNTKKVYATTIPLKEGNTAKEITFKDLYEYIQEAERDDVGRNFPFKENYNTFYHIYNGKHQMNLNHYGKVIADFLFEPFTGEVGLVPVSESEVAEYENQKIISWDTPISADCDDPEAWYKWFGEKGGVIKEILLDHMTPLFAK